jgi:hypothetical protein
LNRGVVGQRESQRQIQISHSEEWRTRREYSGAGR